MGFLRGVGTFGRGMRQTAKLGKELGCALYLSGLLFFAGLLAACGRDLPPLPSRWGRNGWIMLWNGFFIALIIASISYRSSRRK